MFLDKRLRSRTVDDCCVDHPHQLGLSLIIGTASRDMILIQFVLASHTVYFGFVLVYAALVV